MNAFEEALAIREQFYQQISEIQDPVEKAQTKKLFDSLLRPLNKKYEKHKKRQQLQQDFKQAMESQKIDKDYEYRAYLWSMKVSTFKEHLDSMQWTELPKSHQRVLWDELNEKHLFRLRENYLISYQFLKQDIITFKELVDKFNLNDKTYYMNYTSPPLLKYLFDKGLVSDEDLKYFLLKGSPQYFLDKSCFLRTYVLENFLIDEEIYNAFLKKRTVNCPNFKPTHQTTIFDYIRRHNSTKNVEKLVSMNEKLYALNNFNLSPSQKKQIAQIAEQNEQFSYKLSNIVDNQLGSAFDSFDDLMSYLNKREKKQTLVI